MWASHTYDVTMSKPAVLLYLHATTLLTRDSTFSSDQGLSIVASDIHAQSMHLPQIHNQNPLFYIGAGQSSIFCSKAMEKCTATLLTLNWLQYLTWRSRTFFLQPFSICNAGNIYWSWGKQILNNSETESFPHTWSSGAFTDVPGFQSSSAVLVILALLPVSQPSVAVSESLAIALRPLWFS